MLQHKPGSRFQTTLVIVGVAVLYVAFAKLGLALAFRAAQVSAVWPPTGFALAAVVLLGRRAIPGIFAGAFLANATAGEPLWVAAGVGAGNTIEAVLGKAILERLRFDAALTRLRDVLALLAAVAVAPLVSATIGVSFLVAGGLYALSAAPALWPVWWLGDALGGLIVAPLLLAWWRDRVWRRRGLVEPALMLAGVVLSAGVVFTLPPDLPAPYLVYPFLIWSALRLGPAWTVTASLVVNAIAVTGTLLGHGPFAGAGPERGLVLVQLFIAVGATTALLLSAVTAQSRTAHERAETSEQRLQIALAGARAGVWDWEIESGRVVWSEALESLHGFAPGGFDGTYETYRRTIHPADIERVEAHIRQAVATREPFEDEFRVVGPDGVVRWTSARGIVVADEKGRPAHMIGVGIEVTDRKKIEEELRRQDQRKDEFLAMLGHELRNPLAAIVHAVDLLSSTDTSVRDEAGRVIRRQAHSLSRLVDDLLDVARITRGQITLHRRPLALHEIVRAGADVWRHLIEQKGQRLVLDLTPSAIVVDADGTRLTQVIANLLHNAAKFTHEGGTIRVDASVENGCAVLRVRDDGEGMTPEVLAHAFDLFVQGTPSIDRQQGGLGLGLTLVRRLVEMHGGTVEAMSAGPGRGTEIAVRLPLADAADERVPEQRRAAVVPPRARRVLVVEDNEDARSMLVALLQRDGHDVRYASDGHAAVAEAAAFAPEVVLLDVGLPGLDGYAVARELRASPRTAESFLIALTGYGQPEDREKVASAGFDHYLLKPAEPAQVREAILRQRRAPASSGS